MSAMSLLYSMLMDFDRSEFWYQKLKEYRDSARGSEQREATCRLVYLDISLPNRGKDFCEWSKHDREIAVSAGKIVCTFLGKYGKGLVNVALAEGFFEKGGGPYEVISLVSNAKLEAETGGKLELYFAAKHNSSLPPVSASSFAFETSEITS